MVVGPYMVNLTFLRCQSTVLLITRYRSGIDFWIWNRRQEQFSHNRLAGLFIVVSHDELRLKAKYVLVTGLPPPTPYLLLWHCGYRFLPLYTSSNVLC